MRFFGWVGKIFGTSTPEETKAMQGLRLQMETDSKLQASKQGPTEGPVPSSKKQEGTEGASMQAGTQQGQTGDPVSPSVQASGPRIFGTFNKVFGQAKPSVPEEVLDRVREIDTNPNPKLNFTKKPIDTNPNPKLNFTKKPIDTNPNPKLKFTIGGKLFTEVEQEEQEPKESLITRLVNSFKKSFGINQPSASKEVPAERPNVTIINNIIPRKEPSRSAKNNAPLPPSTQNNKTPPLPSGEEFLGKLAEGKRAREDLLANEMKAHNDEVVANIAAHKKAANIAREVNQLPPSTFLRNYLQKTGPELDSGMKKLVKDTEALQEETKALVGSQTRQGKDTNVDEFLSEVALKSPKKEYSAPLALTTPASSPLGQTSALPSATSALTRASSSATTQPTRSSPTTYTGVGAVTGTADSNRQNPSQKSRTDNWIKSAPKKIKVPNKTPSPKTGEDTNGKYRIVNKIKYHNLELEKEEEGEAPKAKDTRTPAQRYQDTDNAIKAAKKELRQFTENQRAQEAENEVKFEDRKLVASQKPHRETPGEWRLHNTIDTTPLSTSMQKTDPNSTIRERKDQKRQSEDRLNKSKDWENPAITHNGNNTLALHASQSAQTSPTSGARNRLLQDKENTLPGHEDPHEKHYATAFQQKTENGFAAQVLASAATNGTGLRARLARGAKKAAETGAEIAKSGVINGGFFR